MKKQLVLLLAAAVLLTACAKGGGAADSTSESAPAVESVPAAPAGDTVTWLCGLYRVENGYPAFVILTREPSTQISRIHDRMPLILPADKIDEWITPSSDPDKILPYALTDMIMEKG